MIVHLLILLVGGVMILAGANFMTLGATAVARRFGVSDFVIGLTLVAFGSSAPDLAVGVLSALKGHTQFAIGNVVGGDTFDGWLVLGVVALIAPVEVSHMVRRIQLPMLLFAYAVIMVCANDRFFGSGSVNVFSRSDGALMVLFFILIMWICLRKDPRGAGPTTGPKHPVAPKNDKWSKRKVIIVSAQILGGLAALAVGGDLFVDGASGVSKDFHLSQTVMGLTVVALGTSLPDLATSAVAARKKHPGIAVGNIVGSLLMDELLVLGCSALAAPLPMGGMTNFNLLAMMGAGIAFLIFACVSKTHRVNRWEGGFMVTAYLAYIVYVIMG